MFDDANLIILSEITTEHTTFSTVGAAYQRIGRETYPAYVLERKWLNLAYVLERKWLKVAYVLERKWLKVAYVLERKWLKVAYVLERKLYLNVRISIC
ncbi:MAG: hypothetical protein UH850_07520 [Paludibacteraceae bacterium]|nr:hypothetical protein [Paludibacteraceae bacterium]